MIVRHFQEIEAVEPMDGVKKRVVIGENAGAPTFIMRIFDIDPGKSSPYHVHPWEHEVFVLQGRAVVTDGAGDQTTLVEGDTIYIPPDEKHCLTNTGDTIFRFMCLIPTGVDESAAQNVV